MPTTEISSKDLWKAIVLYGLNQATYKMALANVLVGFSTQQKHEIKWDELAEAFLLQYTDRLKENVRPQQATFGRLTKMERIVQNIKAGICSYTEGVDLVAAEGFNDVVPRFQTIGMDKRIVGSTFYEIEFGKRIVLTNELLQLTTDGASEFLSEIQARWSLLEGAFEIGQSAEKLELANNIRETFLKDGTSKRASLTDNVPFLAGYQGNSCFYCGEAILDTPHVDHVLPRQVIMDDNIWNLVLAHSHCNLQKSDKLIGEHFLQKLIFRNENIMGSNHPWKKKISLELGSTKSKRISKTKSIYELVKVARGEVYWGSDKGYDPRNDDFYKRFITVLNNGSGHV